LFYLTELMTKFFLIPTILGVTGASLIYYQYHQQILSKINPFVSILLLGLGFFCVNHAIFLFHKEKKWSQENLLLMKSIVLNVFFLIEIPWILMMIMHIFNSFQIQTFIIQYDDDGNIIDIIDYYLPLSIFVFVCALISFTITGWRLYDLLGVQKQFNKNFFLRVFLSFLCVLLLSMILLGLHKSQFYLNKQSKYTDTFKNDEDIKRFFSDSGYGHEYLPSGCFKATKTFNSLK